MAPIAGESPAGAPVPVQRRIDAFQHTIRLGVAVKKLADTEDLALRVLNQ